MNQDQQAMQTLSETLRRRLTAQGFACEVELVGQMAPWLRWTPALGALWIAAGTTARSPTILWSFSLCAAAGAMGWHPFDALFNHGVRHLLDLPQLPANPVPRRFAMTLAAIFSAVTGLLAMLLVFALGAVATRAESVDVALVLAADVSRSIDSARFLL